MEKFEEQRRRYNRTFWGIINQEDNMALVEWLSKELQKQLSISKLY